jgi:16S rRNA (adenine1518-N6/adenine1519-N6)-dimethyltransferase
MNNLLPSTDFLILQLKLKRFFYKRSIGQHFLMDDAVLDRIAGMCACTPATIAVEIGPGAGMLTAKLAAGAGQVVAVEFDQRLSELHQDVYTNIPQIRFHYGDAMKTYLAALASQAQAANPSLTDPLLTGNLPFQITSPLLFAQCGPGVPWRRMVFMIQKEVGDRIASPAGCRDYGILSVKLGLWWRVTERFDVAADKFFPVPKVDAAVLAFAPRGAGETPTPEEWPGLSRFVDAAFAQRRKFLVNSVMARWGALASKDRLIEGLQALGHNEKTRAEVLTPDEFATLYRGLVRK